MDTFQVKERERERRKQVDSENILHEVKSGLTLLLLLHLIFFPPSLMFTGFCCYVLDGQQQQQ